MRKPKKPRPVIPVVYQIRNTLNGRKYIGSTKNLIHRVGMHLSLLRRGLHNCLLFQSDFREHGENAFVPEILEHVALSDLLPREQHYLDANISEYNISRLAGMTRLGLKSTPQHIARMKVGMKGRISPMKGRHFTDEHRRKLSESCKRTKALRRIARGEMLNLGTGSYHSEL